LQTLRQTGEGAGDDASDINIKVFVLLSDEWVMDELSVNPVFMYFIGIEPDEKLPETSLLTKFRKQHLHEIAMDEIITEIVRQCIGCSMQEHS
jgi:hypothetical protein